LTLIYLLFNQTTLPLEQLLQLNINPLNLGLYGCENVLLLNRTLNNVRGLDKCIERQLKEIQ